MAQQEQAAEMPPVLVQETQSGCERHSPATAPIRESLVPRLMVILAVLTVTLVLLVLANQRDGITVASAFEAPPSLGTFASSQFTPHKGFDLSKSSIPIGEIHDGGPPKDGIPAILSPEFVDAKTVTFLKSDDLVMGYVHNEEARAYPLRILSRHEIVNDTVGEQPIAATYCPLCGTCMVFDRHVGERDLTFGVSGLLYKSDVLMYDHQTDSLWSQIKSEAVSGNMVGTPLQWLPSEQMTWREWKSRYPESLVLSMGPRNNARYASSPYARYAESDMVMFPVPSYRTELKDKDWVVGILVEGVAKAYPVEFLSESGRRTVQDRVGNTDIVVYHDAGARRTWVERLGSGEQIPHVTAYWFAWQAFHPETELMGAKT